MVFYTLNQVINLIETIALNHAQVNSFGFGDVSDISTVQEDYPLVWLNVQPSTINENTFTLSLSLLTLDIQKADQANERDTLSDTLSIAQDIYSALTNPEYEDYFIIQYSTSLTPVREGLPDLVNGWGAELLLDIAQIRDRCQIPTKGFIGVSPSNSIAPTISPSGVQPVGTLFTASVGTWVGTLPITYEYRWTRNGTPINGATNSTYTSVNADEGSTIRCEVRATNDYGTSSYVASSNSSLCGAVPVNTVAPTLSPSGSQVTGAVITLGNGTWTGTSPITFEYRWTRDNVVISGETANTYTILAGDDGTVIKGQVRATNAAGVSSYVTTSNQVDAVNEVFNPITTAYMTATGMPNDGTVYYASTAYEITGAEMWTLVDAFVVSGETDGWLTKVHAMYLYLGGTASTFKWNLVDPQDTNAAHRLQFFNTVSGDFGATGWTPNGSNSYALTYVKGSDFVNNSTTIGFYSRTNAAVTMWDIGGAEYGEGFGMLTRRDSDQFNGDMYANPRRVIGGVGSDSRGLFIETRRSATDHEAYKNGVSIGTDTGTNTFDITTMSTDIALGAYNVAPSVFIVGHSTREQAMSFFASGFTATDVTNLTAANLALQTGLKRNV